MHSVDIASNVVLGASSGRSEIADYGIGWQWYKDGLLPPLNRQVINLSFQHPRPQ
jgi:hypothetical protein